MPVTQSGETLSNQNPRISRTYLPSTTVNLPHLKESSIHCVNLKNKTVMMKVQINSITQYQCVLYHGHKDSIINKGTD